MVGTHCNNISYVHISERINRYEMSVTHKHSGHSEHVAAWFRSQFDFLQATCQMVQISETKKNIFRLVA